MDSGTKTVDSSLFSHGLKIAVVFAAFPEYRSCPEDRSRRSRPRWYARAFAVMANTSPGDISHSDGHSLFKVQVLLQVQFNEKMRPFPYIQEVGKERKTG